MAICLVLLVTRDSIAQTSVAVNCQPHCFDRVTVNNNEIVVTNNHCGGPYNYKCVFKPNREIETQKFDKKGNEIKKNKLVGDELVASPGEEVEEHLKLLEWNGAHAVFKLRYVCDIPACEPREEKECIFTVKESWEKKEE